jgi:hypothetical protein
VRRKKKMSKKEILVSVILAVIATGVIAAITAAFVQACVGPLSENLDVFTILSTAGKPTVFPLDAFGEPWDESRLFFSSFLCIILDTTYTL